MTIWARLYVDVAAAVIAVVVCVWCVWGFVLVLVGVVFCVGWCGWCGWGVGVWCCGGWGGLGVGGGGGGGGGEGGGGVKIRSMSDANNRVGSNFSEFWPVMYFDPPPPIIAVL